MPETEANELAYLRADRGRARVVPYVVSKLIADREAGDAEVMAAAENMRNRATEYPEP